MLLRSVTQHVNSQNWIGVFLDFVIVVLGVFIGIQVANWNAEQVDLRASERLLLRLEQDFGELRDDLESLDAAIHTSMLALDAQLTALENGEPLPTEQAQDGLGHWISIQVIPPPPASFDEMIATGRLDLIRSTAVRTRLQHLKQLADTTKAASAQHAEAYTKILWDLNPYIRSARAPQLATAQQSLRAERMNLQTLDQSAMWKDPKARTALYMLYGMFSNMQQWSHANRGSIDRFLETMAQDQSSG